MERCVILHFTLFRHLSSNCTPPAVWGPKQKHPSGWQRPWQQVGEGKPRYLRQSDVSGGQVWICHVGGKCFGNSLCGVSYQSNLHLKVWTMLDDVGLKGLLQLFSYGRCVNLEPTVTNIEPQQDLTPNKEPRTNSLQRIFHHGCIRSANSQNATMAHRILWTCPLRTRSAIFKQWAV